MGGNNRKPTTPAQGDGNQARASRRRAASPPATRRKRETADDPPDEDSLPPATHEEAELRFFEACEAAAREAFDATRNPVYVWELITARQHAAFMQSLAKPWSRADGLPTLKRDPLPDWISEYLERVAWRFRELREGRDWRRFPRMTGNQETDDAAFHRYRESVHLTPPKAAELIPLALGITRQAGWNGFAEWRTIRTSQAAEDWLQILQQEWGQKPKLKPGEAKEQTMREFNFNDERAFRRFLAKGQLRQKTKRAKPEPQD